MAKEPINPGELETELRLFIGTHCYYQHIGNVVLTDGARHLADRAGAYWLMDVVASWQTAKKSPRQKIPYTDFPLRSQRLYLVNDGRYRVLMLPSEY